MEFFSLLVICGLVMFFWKRSKKNQDLNKNLHTKKQENNDNVEYKHNFTTDYQSERVTKQKDIEEGRRINQEKINYKIKDTSLKNKMIINIVQNKTIESKMICSQGFKNHHCISIVELYDNRVLGFKSTKNIRDEWIFEKAFDVKVKDNKFIVEEIMYCVEDFILLEKVTFSYFKKGYGTYKIENISIN
ncbi:MAG: hypothetical protein WA945_02695 [Arcobacteraceae bacterium]